MVAVHHDVCHAVDEPDPLAKLLHPELLRQAGPPEVVGGDELQRAEGLGLAVTGVIHWRVRVVDAIEQRHVCRKDDE